MDQTSLHHVREFLAAVIPIMASIPRPMPSAETPAHWDGCAILDVSALHTSAERLPADIRQAMEQVLRLCDHILERQADIAELALVARMHMLRELVLTTGLHLAELAPVASRRIQRAHLAVVDDEFGADRAAGAEGSAIAGNEWLDGLRADVAAFLDQVEKPSSGYAQEPLVDEVRPRRGRRWRVAAGALVAAAVLVTWHWYTPGAPAPSHAGRGFSIDRTVTSGDVTMVVSHGERLAEGEATRLHVYVFNQGDEDTSTTLTVEQMPAGGEAATTVIPARSVRHQVVEVSDAGEKKVRMSLAAVEKKAPVTSSPRDSSGAEYSPPMPAMGRHPHHPHRGATVEIGINKDMTLSWSVTQ